MSNYQGKMFLGGFGDVWFVKNKPTIDERLKGHEPDPIFKMIEKLKLKPEFVLDLGCSNGWRMKILEERYGAEVFGIDPSRQAIEDGINSGLNPAHINIGTADNIPTKDNSFDLIIMGQVMYFVDVNDWLKVVAETTRVLKDGGYIILRDYISNIVVKVIYQKDIQLTDGRNMPPVYGFYYNWPSLWLSHQGYTLHKEYVPHQDQTVTCAIQKQFNSFLNGMPIP